MKVLPFLKLEEEKNTDTYDNGKKKLNTYLIVSIVLVVERILRWHSRFHFLVYMPYIIHFCLWVRTWKFNKIFTPIIKLGYMAQLTKGEIILVQPDQIT